MMIWMVPVISRNPLQEPILSTQPFGSKQKSWLPSAIPLWDGSPSRARLINFNTNPCFFPVDGKNGTYKATQTGRRLKAFDDISTYAQANLLDQEFNNTVLRARESEVIIGSVLTASATAGVDFDANFANAQTTLGNKMKTIAKLIAGRDTLGNQRQTFFLHHGWIRYPQQSK